VAMTEEEEVHGCGGISKSVKLALIGPMFRSSNMQTEHSLRGAANYAPDKIFINIHFIINRPKYLALKNLSIYEKSGTFIYSLHTSRHTYHNSIGSIPGLLLLFIGAK